MGATSRDSILGNVEVGGVIYQIAPLGAVGYEAIRLVDSQKIGSVISAVSGWMWRLQSESPELMREIVQEAISSGLLQAPPPD
jgi:hypothetical protein